MKKQLPTRPSLEQLKNQAKALLNSAKSGEPEALQAFREHHPQLRSGPKPGNITLADAQLTIAKQYGFASWAKLKEDVAAGEKVSTLAKAADALAQAAGSGDTQRIDKIARDHPEALDERTGPGFRTALTYAVFGNQAGSIRRLLELGANPNVRDDGDYAMPLHFACEKNNLEMVRLLVEAGADTVAEGDYHELGVIGWATCFGRGDKELVEYLLAHGGRHNIFSAVATGDSEAVRRIGKVSPQAIRQRMDPANQRRLPLHLAVTKKQPGSLAALLELGADTEALDEAFLSALDQAALDGEGEMAALLIRHGATIRVPSSVALNRVQELERLLRQDPECLKPGGRWETLIVRASENGFVGIIENLVKYGASVNIWDSPKTAVDSTTGYTALHAAAFHGNLAAAETLMKLGANVRTREDKYGGTPAGWANFAGHPKVRDLILSGPIEPFEAIEFGRADLLTRILDQDPESLERRFGEYLIDPNHATGTFKPGVLREAWRTPLAFAVAMEDAEAVRILVAHGANRDVRSPDGRPLPGLPSGPG